MSQIFFSIGTNLGDREDNLRQALVLLNQTIPLDRLSTIYETAPWGPIQDQPFFLNCCARGTADMAPLAVLDTCKAIEEKVGRMDSRRWGPRLIDIDLLFFDSLTLTDGPLILPHAQIENRGFVLVPLADIAPDFEHPVLNQTIGSLASNISSDDVTPYLTRSPVYLAGSKPLIWGQKTLVMGILNATPDSFSGDGLLAANQWQSAALEKAAVFIDEGADIIDIGGQSTRPGAAPVLAEEEMSRVVPLVEAIRQKFPEVILSVDTFRANVAHLALASGADWINDVTGLQSDENMVETVLHYGAPVVLMHNGRGRERVEVADGLGGQTHIYRYTNFIEDVLLEMQHLRDQVTPFHISPQKIILDPGIGFGKAGPQNITLIREFGRFKTLGLPLLLGSSRKGFVGHYLGGHPPAERLEGTAVTNAVGILNGADIIRVHDVKQMVRVARMADAFVRLPPGDSS